MNRCEVARLFARAMPDGRCCLAAAASIALPSLLLALQVALFLGGRFTGARRLCLG
jgi:hypothetical protein